MLIGQVTEHLAVRLLAADTGMLQFSITTTPSGRVLVSTFLPGDFGEGYPLGALIAVLGCLEQFGFLNLNQPCATFSACPQPPLL